MATKRVPLSERRAKDKKGGVDTLFSSSEPATKPVAAVRKVVETTQKVVKATFYVRPEQIVAIEAIQLTERQTSGKRRDKSELVQEALDLLIKKYA